MQEMCKYMFDKKKGYTKDVITSSSIICCWIDYGKLCNPLLYRFLSNLVFATILKGF